VTLPPRPLRRVLIGPAFILLTLVAITALPLELLVAALASRYVPGRWRPLRILWFAVVWMTLESLILAGLFGLWIGSGLGWKVRSPRSQAAHYRLMGWFLRLLVASARRTFGLEIVTEDPDRALSAGRPLLVLSRHAGPGDSLLLVHNLTAAGRRPRVILKDALQWDPAIDTAFHRLPNGFVSSGEEAVATIARLAGDLGPADALVIFPEGANFTTRRRQRAIERLEAAGLSAFAERATTFEYLLPPKPTGVNTAVSHAPGAAIALVAHSGLEGMNTVKEIWSGLRMDITVRARVWRYEVGDLPATDAGVGEWLYDRWEQMNTWLRSLDIPAAGPGTEPAS
jgi:1-acyl-sn-glycerol-3-phosphate acyltransferase